MRTPQKGEGLVDLTQAVVYGVVQGATEYLPVSSTAHLAIVPALFHWPHPSFAFDILVQLGTLGAVCLYLRADLTNIVKSSVRGLWMRKPLHDAHARMGWMLIVATLPAVVLGLLFKDVIEAQLSNSRAIFTQLLLNGLMLIGAEKLARPAKDPKEIGFVAALLVGCAQALAILPSISRSGSTIAAAMMLGLPRAEAGRFSFLMSVPVMLGAGLIGAKDLLERPDQLQSEGPPLLLAFTVAALVGFLVIRWFLGFVRRHSLTSFGVYCCVIALLGLALVSA
jgi:undecaprenyl-diphosphatase